MSNLKFTNYPEFRNDDNKCYQKGNGDTRTVGYGKPMERHCYDAKIL